MTAHDMTADQTTTSPAIPHAWHSINGLELDLCADGSLVIVSTGPANEGRLELDARGAVGLMMFFQFPGVAALLTRAEAIEQARREGDTQADLREGERMAAAHPVARAASSPPAAPAPRSAAEQAAYDAGVALGRQVAAQAAGEQLASE